MRYFNSLPFITTVNNNGNLFALKNILIRTELIPQLSKNPLLFYKYDLQDGDTPEIVANKYYGDSYRYWIVLYGNPSIMDPQRDWPLSSQQFTKYLADKYADVANGDVLAYTQTTVHHYEKLVTTVDGDSQTTVIKSIEVDENTYNSIIEETKTQTFPNGSTVVYSISRKVVNIFDYENNLNESKRSINLINSAYANEIENRYQTLVSV